MSYLRLGKRIFITMSKRKAPSNYINVVEDKKDGSIKNNNEVAFKKKKEEDVDGKKSNNARISDFLFELANYEKNVTRNVHKASAYRKAAAVVAKHDEEITSGEQAKKLPGVGKKIAEKIEEFLKTGKLKKLEKIRTDDTSVALNLLTRVVGIGPAKAKELVDQGITNIEELRKNQDKLNHTQKVGLKHFEDFEERIPRQEMEKIEKIVNKEIRYGEASSLLISFQRLQIPFSKLSSNASGNAYFIIMFLQLSPLSRKLDKEFVSTIVGSYRRGLSSSGDVDFLITHPRYTSKDKGKKHSEHLKKVVDSLIKSGLITDTISLGETKFMGVCRLPGEGKIYRRMDIRLLPVDQV